jgi:hypothetical protein
MEAWRREIIKAGIEQMYEKEVEIEPIQHVQKEHDFNG